MDEKIEETVQALRGRHLNALFAETSEIARAEALRLIPVSAVVGIGDSTTLAQIGVKEEMKKRETRVLDGFEKKAPHLSIEEYAEVRRRLVEESTVCDIFLTSTNAVTEDGRLVNMDATGNRVAGIFWGHPLTIIVVGRNKIVKDLDEAFDRVRNVIAPNHLRIRSVELGGRPRDAPCAKTGRCSDCRSPGRICNVLTVIEGKPSRTEINVIIVNEDLGLGWDPSWPKERIDRIIENYKRHVWIPPANPHPK